MQTPHRSEFFGLCFSLSSMDRPTQNTGCFVLPPRVDGAFSPRPDGRRRSVSAPHPPAVAGRLPSFLSSGL